MGATPEDTQREIGRLRGDMSAAIEEVERRFRSGLRGAATAEARISGVRAGEEALERVRQNPTLLGVAGVVAVVSLQLDKKRLGFFSALCELKRILTPFLPLSSPRSI